MKQFSDVRSILTERYPNSGKMALLFCTALLLAVVMISLSNEHGLSGSFRSGELARRSIRSPIDFVMEDTESMERLRAEQEKSVRRVFILEDNGQHDVHNKVKSFFKTLDNFITTNANIADKSKSAVVTFTDEQRNSIERQFSVDLIGEEWNFLSDRTAWTSISSQLELLASPVVQQGIVVNKRTLSDALLEYGVVVTIRSTGERRLVYSSTNLFDVREAKQALQQKVPSDGFGKGATYDSVIKKLLMIFAEPNVFFDSQATQREIDKARQLISPVFLQVQRGEILVRAGDHISEVQARKLSHLSQLQSRRSFVRTSVGYFSLIVLIMASIYFFTINIWPTFCPSDNDLSLISMTLVGSVVLVRLFSVMGDSLNLSFPDLDATAFVLASPVAAGGILLAVTMGSASVFMFVLSFALLTGVLLEESWLFLLSIVIGNIVGAISVKRCPRRSFFLWSGIRVAGINVLIVACFLLLWPEVTLGNMFWQVCLAIISGLLSGVLATGLTPIAEYVGSYVTDIKLLELASLDRPLLRELATQAPGTWNHSMIMGQMAEAAADAIGANGLLARLGAYYHDVGKINKPKYFVENETSGENRHEKLSPSMSALVIKAHVKEGMELARQHNLPQALIDFIPQHHGTGLIEYFYDKAQREADDTQAVDEAPYRYCGPKPQSKEAGILMLADVIEASSRTLTDPSIARIQGLVQKMINKVFIKGQLDETDLTLRDLHLVAKSFTRVLSGILHRRIEYAEPAEKVSRAKSEEVTDEVGCVDKKTGNGAKKDGGRRKSEVDNQDAAREASSERNAQKGSTDAIKRLGM